ncbi:hypothetical protein [Aliamphritea spongicola]
MAGGFVCWGCTNIKMIICAAGFLSEFADDGTAVGIFFAGELDQGFPGMDSVAGGTKQMGDGTVLREGISMIAFAVSTETSTWSVLTVSPSCMSHSRISASGKPSPRSGNLKYFMRTPVLSELLLECRPCWAYIAAQACSKA